MDFRATGSNEELFLELLAMDAAEREAFLADLCLHDAARAEQMRVLLASDAQNLDGSLGAMQASDVEDPRPHRVGIYEIRHLVGQGGMGRVFEALHPPTGRMCALKLLQPGLASRRNLARFRREAEVLGRLDHRGIARIYDAGLATAVYAHSEEFDQPYLAMEFIAGTDILAHVRSHNASLSECAGLIAEAADAVHHAHSCGIIHRDLKPANVMVTSEGIAKVVDFGIARLAQEHGDSTTGFMPGTAAYMSPEQLSGLRDRIDTRTDIYGLGATLYALAVGEHPPMGGPGRELPQKWRTGKPDRRLAAILRKAMAPASEERYASAAQFAEELRNWRTGDAILARPERLDWLRRLRRTHPRLLYGGTGLALAAIILVFNPEWQTLLRARLLPMRSHSTLVLRFESTANPGGNNVLGQQIERWMNRELEAGGLLRPVHLPSGMDSIAIGSSELPMQDQLQKLQRAGARYAVAGDFDASGVQPWSTLELRARLLEVPSGRTIEMISVQGSLAEAEALVEDATLRMTEAIGGREQLLRLQPKVADSNDAALEEGLTNLAHFESMKARTLLLQTLNRNFANVEARLALVHALNELGYRDQALRQAQLCRDFAWTGEQRVEATALQKEIGGDTEGGLRERTTLRPIESEDWPWLDEVAIVEDLIAAGEHKRASELVHAAMARSAPSAPEHLRWLKLSGQLIGAGLEEALQMQKLAREVGGPRSVAVSLEQLSNRYTGVGNQDASIEAQRQSADIYAQIGDRNGRIQALSELGQRYQIHGSNARAIEIGEGLMRDVSHTEFSQAEENVAFRLGEAYSRGYDAELSRKMLSRALVLSWAHPDSKLTRLLLWRLGITAREEGNLPEARRLLNLSISNAAKQDEIAGRATNSLGEAEVVAGNADAALAAARSGAELAGSYDDLTMDALLVRTRAMALRKDFSTLDANFTRARDAAVRRGMRGSQALAEVQWGECLLWHGQARVAIEHLQQAEKVFLEIDRPAYRAQAAALLAIAFVRTGNSAAAKAALARSAAVPSMPHFAYSRLLHHVAEGHLAAALGNAPEAVRLLRATREEARRLGIVTAAMAAEQGLEHL